MKDTLSEHDTLAQPNTRLQKEGHTASSLPDSQHTAADSTFLTAPAERLHDGEAQPSEDLTLEKAQLECSVGQDSACVS